MIRQFILSLFRRRRPVVINHYHVQRITDLKQRSDLKHAEMARQIGYPWKGDRLNG